MNIKDHPVTLGGKVVSMSSIPAIVDFLDLDYRSKSIATQIPHDSGLISI